MDPKLINLKNILSEMPAVLAALSGGVDSAFLVCFAVKTLGKDKVLAVTVDSQFHLKSDLDHASFLSEKFNFNHKIINVDVLKDYEVKKNPENRCYLCKKNIGKILKQIALEHNIPYIVDGSNMDDDESDRPGAAALKEADIRSPLREAGLTKKDIRQASRDMGLFIWDKPNSACLATRIPFNTEIFEKDLKNIEKAENFLKEKGFSFVRVRYLKPNAKIVISDKDFDKFADKSLREEIAVYFKELGFREVTLDLRAYSFL